jgi:2-polyprenyl-6-methoxyphenol hydroxylase and related FAD-dependent oxidoreductases
MVPQNVTEQVLLDRLEELGGRVHRPCVATGVSPTADGAEVTLDSGDVIKARYVVAADGMNSTIRDLAGLGYNGNDALSLSFTLADVRVEAACRPTRCCCSSPHPACWSWRRSRTGRSGSWPKSTMRRSSRTSPTRRAAHHPGPAAYDGQGD